MCAEFPPTGSEWSPHRPAHLARLLSRPPRRTAPGARSRGNHGRCCGLRLARGTGRRIRDRSVGIRWRSGYRRRCGGIRRVGRPENISICAAADRGFCATSTVRSWLKSDPFEAFGPGFARLQSRFPACCPPAPPPPDRPPTRESSAQAPRVGIGAASWTGTWESAAAAHLNDGTRQWTATACFPGGTETLKNSLGPRSASFL